MEDDQRVDYLCRYLERIHHAIDEGVDIGGYFVWTLMDNFEWAHGAAKRFGLVYTDYGTQERIVKRSGSWYRDVIENNGFDCP